MSSLLTQLNKKVIISVQLPDKNESQYPQAKIYNDANTLVTTLNLAHKQDGYYMNTYESADNGMFAVLYTIYSDSGYTTRNTSYPVEENDTWYNYPLGGSVSIGRVSDNIKQLQIDVSKWGKKMWETDISEIKDKDSAAQILKSKSEFEPSGDEVMVDFSSVIRAIEEAEPEINLRGVESAIESLEKQLGRSTDTIRKEINIQKLIKKIDKIKIPELDVSELIRSIDGIKAYFPQDRSQEILDSVVKEVSGIQFPIPPDKMKIVDDQMNKLSDELKRLDKSIGSISFKNEALALKNLIQGLKEELDKQKGVLSDMSQKDNKRVGLLAGALDQKLDALEKAIKSDNKESFEHVLDELDYIIRKK